MLSTLGAFARLPRDLRLYIYAWGLVSFGYFGIFGVLFNLYLLRLGYGTETIGLLVGAGQLAWGIAAIPASIVGGRIGNRNAMIWGIATVAVTILFILFAEWLPPALQTGWIATFWISSWIGSALMLVNGTPYVMATCPADDRRAAFTLQQVMLGLCGFIGSVVAGVLPALLAAGLGLVEESARSYWYALWFAPLSYAIATFVLLQTAPLAAPAQDAEERRSSKMPLTLILFVGLLVFLQTSGEGTVRAFFNVFLDQARQVSTDRIGVVMGIGQFLPILSSMAAPWLMTRWGTVQTIILGGVATAICMAVLAWSEGWVMASAGYIGVLLTIPVAAIARGLFSQEMVAPQWRTLMHAAFTIGLALGWSSAAGFGGYLIVGFGFRTLFLMGACASIASCVLVWLYLRTTSQVKPSPAHMAP